MCIRDRSERGEEDIDIGLCGCKPGWSPVVLYAIQEIMAVYRNPVSYTHLDVYKRQTLKGKLEKKGVQVSICDLTVTDLSYAVALSLIHISAAAATSMCRSWATRTARSRRVRSLSSFPPSGCARSCLLYTSRCV